MRHSTLRKRNRLRETWSVSEGGARKHIKSELWVTVFWTLIMTFGTWGTRTLGGVPSRRILNTSPIQWFKTVKQNQPRPSQVLLIPWLTAPARVFSGGGHQRVQQSHLSCDYVWLSFADMQKLLKVTGEKAHTCEQSQTFKGLCLRHRQVQHLSDKIAISVTQLSKPVKKTGLGPVGDSQNPQSVWTG